MGIHLHRRRRPGDFITVLIPEFETRRWWHRLLHNQTGWFLRTYFIFHQDVVVTVVPFHCPENCASLFMPRWWRERHESLEEIVPFCLNQAYRPPGADSALPE